MAKGKAKKPAPKKAKPKGDPVAVRVRMYRHGLGDCFLLRFPRAGKRDFRVLIDCGIIQGTPKVGDKKEPTALERVVADLMETTTDKEGGKPTVDVLVATHEHWDHLAGFAECTEEFDKFDFGQVWLGWTEDPKSATARRLDRERAEGVKALKLGLTHVSNQLGAGGMTHEAKEELDRVGEVLSFFGVDPDPGSKVGLGETEDGDEVFGVAGKPKLSVREARDWCRKHKNVHFWQPGEIIDLSDEVEGLRVFVLGPPTDLKQLAKDAPTKSGREVYEDEEHRAAVSQALFGANVGGDDLNFERMFDRSMPFDPKYRISVDAATGIDFFRTYYFGTDRGAAEEWRRIDGAGLAGAAAFALKLDSDTNNTSLALAFELDDRVLLFPGDAQVGNWESWHADSEGKPRTWTVEAEDDSERTVTAADLLARTVVYKVGHHGSHNATLRGKGLEMMTNPDLVALVPVDTYVAHEKKHWRRMPFEPLMEALRLRTAGRVIVADQTVKDLNLKAFAPNTVADSPDQFAVEVEKDKVMNRPLWVEYSLLAERGT